MTANRAGAWQTWFAEARAARLGGDLLLLADEAPDTEFEMDARILAAESLLQAGATALADEQVTLVLSKQPGSAQGRELRARLAVPRTVPSRPAPPAFIFSGHMVDAAGRPVPRFPATSVAPVAEAIRACLDRRGAREGGLAVSSAAAGGDLLFIEAALAFGLRVTACLPFREERFLASSVSFAGQEWVERYYLLTRAPGVTLRVLPLEPPPGTNPYERCNRWQLYTAIASGAESVHGIILWDGRTGDGPGGTSHMAEELSRRGLSIDVIDPLAC